MVNIEKVSEATWFKVVARGSMLALPIMFAALTWLGTDWLGRVFKAQEEAFASIKVQIVDIRQELRETEDFQESITNRVLALEINSQRGREERMRFQEQMLESLRAINFTLGQLAERTASLEATIKATTNESRR